MPTNGQTDEQCNTLSHQASGLAHQKVNTNLWPVPSLGYTDLPELLYIPLYSGMPSSTYTHVLANYRPVSARIIRFYDLLQSKDTAKWYFRMQCFTQWAQQTYRRTLVTHTILKMIIIYIRKLPKITLIHTILWPLFWLILAPISLTVQCF